MCRKACDSQASLQRNQLVQRTYLYTSLSQPLRLLCFI